MKNFYILFLFIAFTSISNSQTIRYVRQNGTGDGSTWQNASGNLQATINASSTNDEIWVAMGIYKPTNLIVSPLDDTNPVDRRSTFTMKSGLKLFGGFPNTGNPEMSDRDFELYTTTLSGDIGTIDSSSDNSFHILFYPNISDTVLDGFTITSGFANGNSATSNASSYVPYLTADIVNYRGGAIFIYNGDNHTFSNCNIVSNISTYEGGGVYIQSTGNHQFNNTKFENNRGGGFGGAIHGGQSTINVFECIFLENRTILQSGGPYPMPTPTYYASGAAITMGNGNLVLENSLFSENQASVSNGSTNAQGGALFLLNGTHTISNNIFSKNKAIYQPTGVQVSVGGAIYFSGGTSIISNNVFSENLSHGSAGAIYFGGGEHFLNANQFNLNQSIGNGGSISCSGTNLKVINNIFNSNLSGGSGGAIHASFNTGNNFYVNNTFYSNVTNSPNGGGAIYLDNRTDHALNNIFFENKLNNSTVASGADVRFYNSGSSTFLNNFFQTGSSTGGNYGYDYPSPNLTDPANGDFSLQSISICINAGSNSHFLGNYGTTDFLGNPRIFEGTIDMGAIEYQMPLSLQHHAFVKRHTSFTLSPNPVNQNLKIQIQSDEINTISVYDIVGKVHDVFQLQTGLNEMVVTLNPGIYFLKNQFGQVQKLVVR